MLGIARRHAVGAGCAAALLVGGIGTGSAVAATTYAPNRFDDPVPPAGTQCAPPAPANGCSLRGAIDAAHDGDTVQLGSGTYVLSLDELGFTKAITITGAGAHATTIKQTGLGPVFGMPSPSFTWALQGMTITGGNVVATSGASGSGAGDDGDPGTSIGGGGIETSGPLTMTDVVVTGNKVTAGNGGHGVAGNATNAGGDGGGGGTASGGGIEAFAALTLVRVTVTGNIAQGGAGATGARGGASTAGGNGGNAGGADGGGILMGVGDPLTATDTLIAGNQSLPGAPGAGGAGGTSKGAGGDGGIGGTGSGAGIESLGEVNLTNVTLSGNTAGATNGGTGGNARGTSAASKGGRGGTGGGGVGGAVGLVNGGSGHFASATIAGNATTAAAGGPGGAGSDGGANGAAGSPGVSFGGNLSLINAMLQLRNSIVAEGTSAPGAENCSLFAGSMILSLGNNLEDHHQCFTPAAFDRVDTPANLGPLQDNGGPSDTMAPLPGSAVIRGGEVDCADALGNPLLDDQRGLPRPLVCDIGAFQGQAPSVSTPSLGGTAVPGATLTCGTGSVGGDPPVTSGLVWLRDGTPIAGASSGQYTVASADLGHSLSCRVAAINPWGTASATSASVTAFTPKLTALKLSPKKVRDGHKETISFTLNAASRVTFALHRLTAGTKVGKRCVARKGKHKHGRKCTRQLKAHGAPSSVSGAMGSDRVTWKPHGLKPGKYELIATPAGGTGVSTKFTVSKPAKHKPHSAK